MPMASADSVLRVNARSAEVNPRRPKYIVSRPALRHLSRNFYPDKYIQKHYSRGIRANTDLPTKPLFAIPGAKVSHPAEISHEVHRHCDHRRRPCRLDRGRHARTRGYPDD